VIDGKKFTVPENHVVIILPNRIHEYPNETPCVLQCAVFSNDFIPDFFDKIKDYDLENPVIDFTDQKWLLKELANVSWDNNVRVCGLLNLVCDKILSESKLVLSEKRDQSIYRLAVQEISENFMEDLSLKDIAKKLGYHEKYLSSALHSLTKMNFREFLASYRINHAKRLLKSKEGKDLRIIDVALKSGFSSINTFNRVFKENTGKTPLQYKKEK
jgi:AraC-like DNA-binding protein